MTGSGTQVDAAFVTRWIDESERLVRHAERRLMELDAAIGDGDHGTNMARGLRAAAAQVADVAAAGSDATPADLLRATGVALVKTIGGASGPLYGTWFLGMADRVTDDAVVAPTDVVAGLWAGLYSVQQLGAAELGDKTMVDALAPAIEALAEQVRQGVDLERAAAIGAQHGRLGAEATVPMRARKGRASYLGARSEGHLDPGAASSALVLDAFATAARIPSADRGTSDVP